MQRVPSAGYYDNIVEDHSYTMFSMYPPVTTVVDHWQLTKEDAMVRRVAIDRGRISARELAALARDIVHLFAHRLFLSFTFEKTIRARQI